MALRSTRAPGERDSRRRRRHSGTPTRCLQARQRRLHQAGSAGAQQRPILSRWASLREFEFKRKGDSEARRLHPPGSAGAQQRPILTARGRASDNTPRNCNCMMRRVQTRRANTLRRRPRRRRRPLADNKTTSLNNNNNNNNDNNNNGHDRA